MSQLTAYGHTNCCGVNIIVPCTRGPAPIPPNQIEDIKSTIRDRIGDVKSTALVRFMYVPEYFVEEFEQLTAKRDDVTLAARRKSGNLYIICKPPKDVA